MVKLLNRLPTEIINVILKWLLSTNKTSFEWRLTLLWRAFSKFSFNLPEAFKSLKLQRRLELLIGVAMPTYFFSLKLLIWQNFRWFLNYIFVINNQTSILLPCFTPQMTLQWFFLPHEAVARIRTHVRRVAPLIGGPNSGSFTNWARYRDCNFWQVLKRKSLFGLSY